MREMQMYDPIFDSHSITVLGLGFTLGLRHALDTDHLVAISTLVSDRKGIFRTSFMGTMWGIGHTISLLVVGCVVIAFDVSIPAGIANVMEIAVALMLVVLGIRVLRTLIGGGKIHMHVHSHDGYRHVHPHVHENREENTAHTHHLTRWWLPRELVSLLRANARPLVVGLIHGLAGSAALMLVVLTTIQSFSLGLLYIIVFGIGSIGGMTLMSATLSLPFTFTSRFEKVHTQLRWVAGMLSIIFGVFLGGSVLLA